MDELDRVVCGREGRRAGAAHELVEAYDRLSRVEDALRHADVLVDWGSQSAPEAKKRRGQLKQRRRS